MESTLDNLFKDFERSNVPRVKLSLFSKSDDIFTSGLIRSLPAKASATEHLPVPRMVANFTIKSVSNSTNDVVSCSTLSDQGYAEDFYD
ncbi:hypothetical protein Tco_0514808 [Tanacetum coccineum]